MKVGHWLFSILALGEVDAPAVPLQVPVDNGSFDDVTDNDCFLTDPCIADYSCVTAEEFLDLFKHQLLVFNSREFIKLFKIEISPINFVKV